MARVFNLPETKGKFELRGIVKGTESNNFYKETMFRNGKMKKDLRFGIQYDKDATFYVNIEGSEQDNVYYAKKTQKGEKSETKTVPWSQRKSIDTDENSIYGAFIGGLEKKYDEKGQLTAQNQKSYMTDFDACDYVHEKLHDGQSVYVRGNLNFSSYVLNGQTRHSTKYDCKQVSLTSEQFDESEFGKSEFVPQAKFDQIIIYMGIEDETDDTGKKTGRAVLKAKIVTYSGIEDVEFIMVDRTRINTFRKYLKPYNSLRVQGHLQASQQIEQVEEDDGWGVRVMDKPRSTFRQEMIIDYGDGNNIDTTTYTKAKVDEAYAAINKSKQVKKDFGESGSRKASSGSNEWGSYTPGSLSNVDDDFDDDPWDFNDDMQY